MYNVLIVTVIFISFVALVKILSDNHTRKLLIQKGLVDEKVRYLFANQSEAMAPSSMKWGMVLIAMGLAFVIGLLVPSNIQGEVTLASLLILAGLALLIFYGIARKMASR